MRRREFTLLALATTLAWPAFADDYPGKPIKVISDSAPGSAIDVAFRMVMDRLGTVLGQQIVPVDQPGAVERSRPTPRLKRSLMDIRCLHRRFHCSSLFLAKLRTCRSYCLAISFQLVR